MTKVKTPSKSKKASKKPKYEMEEPTAAQIYDVAEETLYNQEDAAEYLRETHKINLKATTLQSYRTKSSSTRGPDFYIDPLTKAVRYAKEDLDIYAKFVSKKLREFDLTRAVKKVGGKHD